ncbi:MAG: hypothetical protein ACJAZC_000316 [Cryomorphaceae bacterium]|jgi:hypothetical protein
MITTPLNHFVLSEKRIQSKEYQSRKKCIGIDSPGNISGESTSRARAIPKGPKILRNSFSY